MPPPKGLYVVAVVFFIASLISIAQLMNVVLPLFNISGLSNANVGGLSAIGAVAFCVAVWATYLLTQQRPVATWLMYAMTLGLGVTMILAPVASSPFYSPSRLYLNRVLMLLPLAASCLYLARRSRTRWPRR